MKIDIDIPNEFEKGGKFLDIDISPESKWRYKAHDVAVKTASKLFEAEYNRLMNDPDALILATKALDFIELDNTPERQSVQVGEKIVLLNDLLKSATITVK